MTPGKVIQIVNSVREGRIEVHISRFTASGAPLDAEDLKITEQAMNVKVLQEPDGERLIIHVEEFVPHPLKGDV